MRRRLVLRADADHFGAAHQHLGRDAGEIADGENDDDRADAEPAGAHRPAASALAATILDVRGLRHVFIFHDELRANAD